MILIIIIIFIYFFYCIYLFYFYYFININMSYIVNKATQIKISSEEKAKINNKPINAFNTLTTIRENPIMKPVNTITIPEEIPEEEEDAMETEEELNTKTELKPVIEEERVMDTIQEEEEEIEEEKRVIDTIQEEEEEEEDEIISNKNNSVSQQTNPLISHNMSQMQQLQQKQLQLQLQQQLQQQQQMKQLQLQQQLKQQQQQQQHQQQQHQHNHLIQMLQQQTQQRQLQQEQQQRQMEEQEKQIREEQKIIDPPVVPSTINPLLIDKPSNFDRSLNLNSIIILQTLGTGTFGRVHLVRSKENGKYYAMKAIKKSCVVKNHQVEHTMNEKKILENVRHPFFVTLQNTFQDSNHIFFITDYVCGGELFTCLRRYQVGFFFFFFFFFIFLHLLK